MKISLLRLFCEDSTCSLSHRQDFIPTEILRDRDDDEIDILFVGEAPGLTEAEDGRPFIGVSGTLLRRVFRHVKREEKYNIAISNIVRCLPLNHEQKIRPPSKLETQKCLHFLMRDIQKLDPKIIVLLGGTGMEAFFGRDVTVSMERGQYHFLEVEGRERIIFSTWHPAHVGRNKNILPIFYEDIRTVFKLADGWLPDPKWSEVGTSTLLKTLPEIEEYVDLLRRGLGPDDMVAVDVETKNLHKRYGNKLGMIQFAYNEDEAACIPLDHPETPFDPGEIEIIKALLRRLFTKKVSFKYWLAHAGLFEQIQIGVHILNNGGKLQRTFKNVPMIDTMAFAYVLNENKVNLGKDSEGYGLKSLARHFLRFTHYDDETLVVRSKGGLLDLPLESKYPMGHKLWTPNLTDYGGMDGYVTKRLFRALQEEAVEQRYFKKAMALLEHFFSMVYRLISVIERNGFWADLDHLRMLQDPERSPILQRLKEIDEVEIRGFDTALAANEALSAKASGGSYALFNTPWFLDLNKPDHCREWLVKQCKLEPLAKTSTGLASVGKIFFDHYENVPEVALVKERRGLAKLASSYINQLIEYIDPRYRHEDCQDGRIRADIHLTTTVSGRASSSNPNMQQQVKSDSKEKAAIKSIFKAEQPGVQQAYHIDFRKGPPKPIPKKKPENALVQLDFMANEVRWWAICAQCPDLAKAFNDGKALRDAFRANPEDEALRTKAKIEGDIHRQTASMMYEVKVGEVESTMRSATKSIVFGWMFGRGNRAIAEQIKKTVEETAKLIEQFGGKFPKGRDYLHGLPDIARELWFVESPIGRRRRLPGYVVIPSRNGMQLVLTEEVWFSIPDDDRKLIAECDRMAKNSPIQGVASDASFIGSALFCDYIEEHGKDDWLIQNVVHDSCVYQVPIADLEQSVYIAEEIFTNKTMAYMAEHWGINFNCPIEVEFEIGLTWGNLVKWDFTKPGMDKIVQQLTA